jgi:hypothetical protein
METEEPINTSEEPKKKIPRTLKIPIEEILESLPKDKNPGDNIDMKALKKFNLSLKIQWDRINSTMSDCDDKLVSSLQKDIIKQIQFSNRQPLDRTISVKFEIKQKYITNCTLIVYTNIIISEILNSINKKINIDELINCIKRISKDVFKDINYILFLYILEHFEEKDIYLFLCKLWEINNVSCSIQLFILSFLFWFCIRYILEQLYYINRNKPPFSLENLSDVNTIIRLGNTEDYKKWLFLFKDKHNLYEIYAELYQQLERIKRKTLTRKFINNMHIVVLTPVKNMFDIYLTDFIPREISFELICIDNLCYWAYKHVLNFIK